MSPTGISKWYLAQTIHRILFTDTLSCISIGTVAQTWDSSTVTRPAHFSEVSCNGNETSIFQCSHTTCSSDTCTCAAARVVCQGIFQTQVIINFELQ